MDFSSLLILLLIFLTTCFVLMYWKMLKEKSHLPPGPVPLPLIGNLMQLNTKDPVKSLMKLHEKYGPVYTIFWGPQPSLVLCGYKAVKEALIDQGEEFGARGDYPVFLSYTKGHGIAFRNGEKWKELRRFTLLTLRNFGMGKRSIEERIQEEAQFLVKEFAKTKQSPIDPTVFLGRTVSNVICSIIFGRRFDYEDERLLTIVTSINNNFQIMSNPWGTLYNIYPDIMDYLPGQHQKIFSNFDKITEIVQKEMKSHKETLDPKEPRDYIDCFLIKMQQETRVEDPSFYEKSLLMSVQNLLFGGTETVSTTLRYGFLILMKYPEIAEKIQKEIDNVVGRDRCPCLDDKSRMPFTEAVIHEIMRFADVIPLSLPHAVSHDTVFRGYKIPKGTYVIPLLTSVHYDPSQFKSINTFNPQNFLDENGRFKRNDALMPFSAGKRICLGESLARMELFLYFTTLLQNFTFQPTINREELDLTPVGSGLGNVPSHYNCCLVPR
ncbi:cytochrome P450 2F5-like [Rhinatrema bivittatum]|uniref:cytochrome P450 2F5-like n=1 Tax=Rhinatrema bivittatum TaxID=194408 RepID=UPI001129CCDE|nr:cytochrome P450 2F5-like [Rhinatrema bivittatum]XP_029427606.1 cytochrome P450 2F5-like [Rhinatrema bivittatum]